MGHINMHGMAQAFPQYQADKDYHLVDFHDGKGVQIIWLADCEQPDLIPAEEATAAWQAEQDAIAYREKRAQGYPPLLDYIDAQVKKASGDPDMQREGFAQEALYFAACLANKRNFPKGSA